MKARSFTWADLPALAEFIGLVCKAAGDDRSITASSLEEELSLPGLSPEANCSLFEDRQGQLLAYSLIHPELPIRRTVLDMGFHPSAAGTGLEREVVQRGLARAGELGAAVLHICVPPSRFWRNTLEGKGFSLVRKYWTMRWQDETVPPMRPPKGTTVLSFQPGDEERLTRVQNAVFGGSWGFAPNTIEEVARRVGMSVSSPGGILFLTHGEETSGYCWTTVQNGSSGPIGCIAMIGVAPSYRGRGLGKPILLAGMDYLHSKGVDYIKLEVDGRNGSAIRLYRSVGFKKTMEVHWFEAPPSGA